MNRAHQGAFNKGAQAARDGKPVESCPYRDIRKLDGRLTWSRAFALAWRDGYRSVTKAKA